MSQPHLDERNLQAALRTLDGALNAVASARSALMEAKRTIERAVAALPSVEKAEAHGAALSARLEEATRLATTALNGRGGEA
jgi:hypothetical protein